jgi:hypothetical protein
LRRSLGANLSAIIKLSNLEISAFFVGGDHSLRKAGALDFYVSTSNRKSTTLPQPAIFSS